jgi:hypothetical protein
VKTAYNEAIVLVVKLERSLEAAGMSRGARRKNTDQDLVVRFLQPEGCAPAFGMLLAIETV